MEDNDKNQQGRVPANDRFVVPDAPAEFQNLFAVFNSNTPKLADQVRGILTGQPTDLAVRAITHLLVAKTQQTLDMKALQKENDRLKQFLVTDTLTGVYNEVHVRQELARHVHDHEDRRHAHGENHMLYIDLVGFKNINDTYGHAAGDQALRTVASVISKNIRQNDDVARLHGDEFVVMMYRLSEYDATAKAYQIQLALEDLKVTHEGVTFNLPGGSIGHAKIDPNLSPDENLKAADTKMYETKKAQGGSGRKPALG